MSYKPNHPLLPKLLLVTAFITKTEKRIQQASRLILSLAVVTSTTVHMGCSRYLCVILRFLQIMYMGVMYVARSGNAFVLDFEDPPH